MNKRISKVIQQLNMKKQCKNRAFLIVNTIVWGSIGALTGILLNCLKPVGRIEMFCYIGYPAVFIGFMGSILYLYQHEFN